MLAVHRDGFYIMRSEGPEALPIAWYAERCHAERAAAWLKRTRTAQAPTVKAAYNLFVEQEPSQED